MPTKRLGFLIVAASCAACALPFVEQEKSVRVLVYNIHAGKDADGKPNLEEVARHPSSSQATSSITVRFEIGPEGAVIHASVEKERRTCAAFRSCVLGVHRSLRFPPPLGGGDIAVSSPYHFFPKQTP